MRRSMQRRLRGAMAAIPSYQRRLATFRMSLDLSYRGFRAGAEVSRTEVTEIERLAVLDAATLWEPRVDYALRQSPQIEMVISTNASNAPGAICEDQRTVDPPQGAASWAEPRRWRTTVRLPAHEPSTNTPLSPLALRLPEKQQ